jgi:2-polyprenyl-6-hydroxyphenyl methylase/3-demethylubiquinone-9 3-methyltransferase
VNTEQFFDERSPNWSDHYTSDPRFRRRYERIAKFLLRVLPAEIGRAFDAGCGSGVFSRVLAEGGWKVTAIDASPEMIAEAQTNSSGAIDFEVCSIDNYPVAPRSYEAIISLSMLEYVEDDDMAIAKFASLLRPGGVLVVSVPNRSGLLRKLEGLIFGIRTVTRGKLFSGRGEYLKYQKRQYSPFELDLLMRQHGLRKKRSIYLNAGFSGAGWLLSVFEQRWWAAMYCGAYHKPVAASL